jgi:replicative DNA helicase
MAAVDQKREPLELLTVQAALINADNFNRVGGSAYLLTLTNSFSAAANAEHYAAHVKDCSVRRRMLKAADAVKELAFHRNGHTTAEFVMECEQKLCLADTTVARSEVVPLSAAATTEYAALEERILAGGRIMGLETGLTALDAKLGGLDPGTLTILAARTSLGKSALGIQIAAHCAENAGPAVIFSLEMTVPEMTERLMSLLSSIPLGRIRHGRTDASDSQRLATLKRTTLDTMPLYLCERPAVTWQQILSHARRLKANGGLRLVVVDYLQLMASDGKPENRATEVGGFAQGLKALAKVLKVPVLALCQLSRAVDARADKEPQLSDLRESGAIEQHADAVVFIHRPDKGRDVDAKAEEATIIVAKNRQGPCGRVKVAFRPQFVRFDPVGDGEGDPFE